MQGSEGMWPHLCREVALVLGCGAGGRILQGEGKSGPSVQGL